MIRAVLFDLDDTLYPEWQFYHSGFAAVAAELHRRGVGRTEMIERLLASLHFDRGRDRVFDRAAIELGFPTAWVPELVEHFYAAASPGQLPDETTDVLTRLRGRYRLGIVTDGHAAVQRRKIAALGLTPLVDAVVVTDEFGRTHWKPDPLPFLKCCEALGVAPHEAVMVGDNPERDVLGARRVGMPAVRIRRPDGYLSDRDEPHWPRADCEIVLLSELEEVLWSTVAPAVIRA